MEVRAVSDTVKQLVEGKYLMYKGRPLVREGNTICYGDMAEKCILTLEIMSYKEESGNKVPDKILVSVIDSKDPTKIIKQGAIPWKRKNLQSACVWLISLATARV